MRDYLSPARSYLGKAKAQVASLSKVTLKPRLVAMLASTAAVAFFAASVIALRTMSNDSTSQGNVIGTETTVSPGASSSTIVGAVPQPSVDPAIDSAQSVTQSSSSTNGTHTTVTVNNQPVAIPQNGSVQRTITSNGSTTHVDISVSNGSTSNSSYHSNTIQMNTNTDSQSVNIDSP